MKNILKKGLAGCFLLFPFLASATEKSDAMGVKDPYGITLTVTSVMVVFVALLVLSIVEVDEHHVGVYASKTDGHMIKAKHPKSLLQLKASLMRKLPWPLHWLCAGKCHRRLKLPLLWHCTGT